MTSAIVFALYMAILVPTVSTKWSAFRLEWLAYTGGMAPFLAGSVAWYVKAFPQAQHRGLLLRLASLGSLPMVAAGSYFFMANALLAMWPVIVFWVESSEQRRTSPER